MYQKIRDISKKSYQSSTLKKFYQESVTLGLELGMSTSRIRVVVPPYPTC